MSDPVNFASIAMHPAGTHGRYEDYFQSHIKRDLQGVVGIVI